MSDDLLSLSARLFDGDVGLPAWAQSAPRGRVVELADGVGFTTVGANVIAFQQSDGIVLVDSGGHGQPRAAHTAVRSWTRDPVHTAIYTHGHIDHVFGVGAFDAEQRVRVVAHENVPVRFERYALTAGYNTVINRRQFFARRGPVAVGGAFSFPTEFRHPDVTYHDSLEIDGGFELQHAKGETDDMTYVWLPERKILCTGDLVIWVAPNCGNPQKVQRYPREWARALRDMASLGADLLLPGHGPPLAGAERIHTLLSDGAEYLESLVDQTLALMNTGARLDEIVHTVKPPEHVAGKPYLRPAYDEPEFIVRNIWRMYGGWHDFNPANLKPAREADVARELAQLAGGAANLAKRAHQLADAGDLRLAGHLAELATLADPDDREAHEARAHVFGLRAAQELSTMATGVFAEAADESRRRADELA